MKTAVPKVSIGMPAFNGQEYIAKALDSLLNQTYSHFELIISDDASTDKTKEICETYVRQDKRIRYIRQRRNIGFVKNFNDVLEHASGTYFMWAGQDDVWDKKFIADLVALLQNDSQAVLAMSNYQNIHRNQKYFVYKKTPFDNSWSKYQTLVSFLKTTNLSFFYGLHKTDALRKAGGYHADSRPLAKSSDYVTIFRVLLEGKMKYTDNVLFFKRDTGLYTHRYETVKKNFLHPRTIQKLKRFMLYPLFYTYDTFFCLKYLFSSRFSLTQKLKLMYYIVASFARRIYGYFIDIINTMSFLRKQESI